MEQAVHWAALGAAVCGLACLLVPRLISMLPEPAPDPDPAPEPHVPPKVSYVDIAASRHLAIHSAAWGALSGAWLGWFLAADPALILWWPLVPLGVALAVVDWRTRLLPTRIIAPAYALTLVTIALAWVVERDAADLARAGLGWLVGGGLFLLMWLIHPRGLGYGDVRLSGVLALALGYLGWPQFLVGVYSGFLLGALIGSGLALARLVDRKGYPFGPFMLAGALVGVGCGDLVIDLVWG